MIKRKWREKKNKWRISYGGKVRKFLWRRNLKRGVMSRSLTVDFIFIFSFLFSLFFFYFYFSFLFLEQLGLGWIGHAVTSVTN